MTSDTPTEATQPVRAVAVGLVVVAAAPLFALLAGAEPLGRHSLPVAATWLLCFVGMAACSARHPIDRANPLAWSCVALLVMYVLHPAGVILGNQLGLAYQGRFARGSTYAEALWLGTVATASLLLGYCVATVREQHRRASAPGSASAPLDHARTAHRLAVACVVMAVAGYVSYALTTGQPLLESVAGGARRGSAVGSTAYLYLAPQLLGPAALLFLYAARASRRFPIEAALVVVLATYLFVPSGQRLVLLTSFVPVAMFAMHLARRRLSALGATAVALLALLAVIALRDVGVAHDELSVGDSLTETATAPAASLETLITGADTEMVDALAIELQYVPEVLDHQPGHTVLAAVAAPVPSVWWPGKPQTADGILNGRILGVERNSPAVAYGLVGELYFDAGRVGVAIGFLLVGVALARGYRWRLAARPEIVMLYFAALPLVVALLRGSLGLILGRSLFTVAPLLLFVVLVGRRRS